MQTGCLFQILFVTNIVCFLPLPVLLMVEGIYSGKNGDIFFENLLIKKSPH